MEQPDNISLTFGTVNPLILCNRMSFDTQKFWIANGRLFKIWKLKVLISFSRPTDQPDLCPIMLPSGPDVLSCHDRSSSTASVLPVWAPMHANLNIEPPHSLGYHLSCLAKQSATEYAGCEHKCSSDKTGSERSDPNGRKRENACLLCVLGNGAASKAGFAVQSIRNPHANATLGRTQEWKRASKTSQGFSWWREGFLSFFLPMVLCKKMVADNECANKLIYPLSYIGTIAQFLIDLKDCLGEQRGIWSIWSQDSWEVRWLERWHGLCLNSVLASFEVHIRKVATS